mmetsp:Transcript_64456/g.112316  ORF Transcript_64456/g.112316 Transcript_64456/m.112316 type:complete len:86 (+) Transcript_64456:3039-3296(+)
MLVRSLVAEDFVLLLISESTTIVNTMAAATEKSNLQCTKKQRRILCEGLPAEATHLAATFIGRPIFDAQMPSCMAQGQSTLLAFP